MEDGPPDLIIGINLLYRQEENVEFYILPVPDSLWISAMTGKKSFILFILIHSFNFASFQQLVCCHLFYFVFQFL